MPVDWLVTNGLSLSRSSRPHESVAGTCVWGAAKVELQTVGHDVVWTGNLSHDPGDEEILALAHREQRVLVTLDKDFGELAIRRSLPHCGVVRLVNIAARQQGTVCQQMLLQYGDELTRAAIITVEAWRVRIRPPDVVEP